MDIAEIKKVMKEIAEIIEMYPENLQERTFDFLISKLFGNYNNLVKIEGENVLSSRESAVTLNKAPVKKSVNSKESYQINKELNLSPKDKESLKQFVEIKVPKTNIEFNVVAIYYLDRILRKEGITIDDVYTCYKDAGRKVPVALKQSLTDTSSSKYGYIAVSNNCFYIPVVGENFVEYELPKK